MSAPRMTAPGGWLVEPLLLAEPGERARLTYRVTRDGLLTGGSRRFSTKLQGLHFTIADVAATLGPAFAELVEVEQDATA